VSSVFFLRVLGRFGFGLASAFAAFVSSAFGFAVRFRVVFGFS
jgi:hypothetical protein